MPHMVKQTKRLQAKPKTFGLIPLDRRLPLGKQIERIAENQNQIAQMFNELRRDIESFRPIIENKYGATITSLAEQIKQML